MKLHQRIQRILIACLISLSSVYGKDRTIEFSDQLPPCPAEYLTDCLLASDGSIWITSEGQGIYCLKPLEKAQAGKRKLVGHILLSWSQKRNQLLFHC